MPPGMLPIPRGMRIDSLVNGWRATRFIYQRGAEDVWGHHRAERYPPPPAVSTSGPTVRLAVIFPTIRWDWVAPPAASNDADRRASKRRGVV
jgi:hypothetical protein